MCVWSCCIKLANAVVLNDSLIYVILFIYFLCLISELFGVFFLNVFCLFRFVVVCLCIVLLYYVASIRALLQKSPVLSQFLPESTMMMMIYVCRLYIALPITSGDSPGTADLQAVHLGLPTEVPRGGKQ